MGLFAIMIWWRYLRQATNVFVENNGLRVVGKTEVCIRYDRIISIDLGLGMLVGTVVINYQNGSGTQKKLSFVPSIQAGGLFFTAEHIQELIKRKIPDGRDAVAK
jgi:hypothetical protein